MATDLTKYTKDQLKDIADQLMIPKSEVGNAKNSTIIAKILDKAEELSVSVPEPETTIEVKTPAKAEGQAEAPKHIKDYPRIKIILEARDISIKQQPVSINTYSALIKIGEEVMIPEPVVDFLEGLTDTIHVADGEGMVKAKKVSRFYVKRVK